MLDHLAIARLVDATRIVAWKDLPVSTAVAGQMTDAEVGDGVEGNVPELDIG